MYDRQYRVVTMCILMRTLHMFYLLKVEVHMLSFYSTILADFSLYLCVCIRTFKDESIRKLSVAAMWFEAFGAVGRPSSAE
jgi:hypothetical protein